MIPTTWIPYRRAEDDELLGYLRPVDGSANRFLPVTVFGNPLGDEADEHEAQQVLDSTGLSYLAGRWLLTLAGRPEPLAVEIVEASPEQLRVKTSATDMRPTSGRSSSWLCHQAKRYGASKASAGFAAGQCRSRRRTTGHPATGGCIGRRRRATA